MTFDNLRSELDELTRIENPAERLLGILRFMALCSGLQAAGLVNVARDGGDGEAQELATEMNELANACLPIAARALEELVGGVRAGRA
ncbi:MAG TPA: hypothetical protein VIV40_36150 [Kofleriaceae bacterium]